MSIQLDEYYGLREDKEIENKKHLIKNQMAVKETLLMIKRI